MQDEQKTKAELIKELKVLSNRIAELEQVVGKDELLFSLFRSIEGRKQAETVLRELEEKWRSLIENVPDIITIVDHNSTILFINRTEQGVSPKEAVGKSIYDFAPAEYHDTMRESLERVFQTGYSDSYEIAGIGSDGTTSWYRSRIGPVKHDGRIIAATIITTDITERKRAEEAYRTLVDHSLQGLVIIQDERVVFVNQAMEEISGYTVDEMLSMSPKEVQEFVHSDDRALVWGRHRERLNGKLPPDHYEFRAIRKDGSIRWLEIHSSRIEYQGKPAIQAAYLDVTEAKMAREALRESEEKYRSLMTNIPLVTWTHDREGNTTFISPNVEQIYGYKPEEIYKQGVRLWFGRIYHDDKEKVQEAYKALFEHGIQFDVEYRIRRKDGEWIWVHDRSVFTYEKDGVMYADGIFSDITERKKAEEELLFKTTLLEAQSETSIDGILVVDDKGKTILSNKRFGQMWKIPQWILDTRDDEKMLQYVLRQLKDPDAFLERVRYLYAHKEEESRDRIEFKDGKVFDRYSSALIDSSGKYQGRIWYFHEVT